AAAGTVAFDSQADRFGNELLAFGVGHAGLELSVQVAPDDALHNVRRISNCRLAALRDSAKIQIIANVISYGLGVGGRTGAAAIDVLGQGRQLVLRSIGHVPDEVRESAPITTPPLYSTAMMVVPVSTSCWVQSASMAAQLMVLEVFDQKSSFEGRREIHGLATEMEMQQDIETETVEKRWPNASPLLLASMTTTRALLGSIGRAKPVEDEPSASNPESGNSDNFSYKDDDQMATPPPMTMQPPLKHRPASSSARNYLMRQDAAAAAAATAATSKSPDFASPSPPSRFPMPGPRRWVRLDQDALRDALREATAKFVNQPALGVTLHCSGADSLAMRHAGALPRFHTGLQRLHELERRLHLLELDRKIANRLRDLALLADQIDRIRDHEANQLADARRPSSSSSASGASRYDCAAVVSSKLGSARALCERLRASLSHAQHVRSYVQASAPLQECLPLARPALAAYKDSADRLLYRALASTRAFLQASLSVLARTGLARHTREDLFELCRGLEEFNSTLDQVKWQRRLLNRRCSNLAEFAAPSEAVEDLRPVTFARLINRLAEERAEAPEVAVHRFYFNCDGLADAIADCGTGVDVDAAQASASAAAVALLSAQTCPITDWLRAEWDFASGLLDCLAQSTQLLPRQGGSSAESDTSTIGGSHSTVVGGLLRKDDTVENLVSGLNSEPPGPQSPPPQPQPHSPPSQSAAPPPPPPPLPPQQAQSSLAATSTSTADAPPAAKKKKKKGVRWSDYSDVPVRHHVVGKYLELVWRQIDYRFHPYRTIGLSWGPVSDDSDRDNNLGCLWLLPPSAVGAMADAVRVTASETSGLFPAKPAALLPCLQSLALRLQLHACQTEWLRAFDRHLALSSQSSTSRRLRRSYSNSLTTAASLVTPPTPQLLQPCLRAVALCCAELSDWLAGRRGGACRVTASQLEAPLAALADWLAASLTTCRSKLDSLTQLACRSLARMETDCDLDEDDELDDVDRVDDDDDVVCDGDDRNASTSRGRRFFAIILNDLPSLSDEISSAVAAFTGALSPRRLPDQCANRLRGRLEAFAALPDVVAATRALLMKRYGDRCLSRARRHLGAFFPSAERAWQLAEMASPPPTASSVVAAGGAAPAAATAATDTLFDGCLGPMLAGARGLGEAESDHRLELLAQPVAALAATWSAELLLRRRRRCEAAEPVGACLGPRAARHLESEVDRLAAYLAASLPDEPVLAARLADLDSIRQLRAGIRLLRRRQPVSRTASCGSLPTSVLLLPPGCCSSSSVAAAAAAAATIAATIAAAARAASASPSPSPSRSSTAGGASAASAASTVGTNSASAAAAAAASSAVELARSGKP
uniref:C2 domain-containing protein n=1 Tax=Macrostomum lignano TaxID=282301 RepID=A0A1I8IBY4_9PLAT